MCKWGTEEMCYVYIDAEHSHTHEARWAFKKIDSCIAPIVRALNAAGILTTSSCCGHGKGDGHVALTNGKVLIVRDKDPAGECITTGDAK